MNRILVALKAIRWLGLRQVVPYALYRLALLSGVYRLRMNSSRGRGDEDGQAECLPLFELPAREDLLAVLGEEGRAALLAEADEIAAGKVRLFGAEPVALRLTLPGKLQHWTAYETKPSLLIPFHHEVPDIKFTWEPARFGWAFTLGRAYAVSGDEAYAAAFWTYFETFTEAYPPDLGPHWQSGQEVALRLMAFLWAGQVFEAAAASTPARMKQLAGAAAAHARRIPLTLVYARSQHNNHLLTEAAALLSAGLALPQERGSGRWRSLGWRWLNAGLRSQIDGYGEYAQHSSNYQRLMLQVVLWTEAVLGGTRGRFPLRWPRATLQAVRRSVHWLLALLDFESGRLPNLGANDGAYIFPLTVCPFEDARPVLHAAARAFLDYDLNEGTWDEMSLWFGVQAGGPRKLALPRYLGDQLYGQNSWAYFRIAQYTCRPSHADQLHLDMWWRGMNLAQDAGTYLYNTPSPWDNSLRKAAVHNTVTVNGDDQMQPGGRFLYLDWVNAYRKDLIPDQPDEIQRVQGRYRTKTIRHTRTVSVFGNDRWLVQDEILPLASLFRRKAFTARLHWLLQDWEWTVVTSEPELLLRVQSPLGPVLVCIRCTPAEGARFSLVRGGEVVAGSAPPDPIRGWSSPTYGVKIPALSVDLETQSGSAVTFTTTITLPETGGEE